MKIKPKELASHFYIQGASIYFEKRRELITHCKKNGLFEVFSEARKIVPGGEKQLDRGQWLTLGDSIIPFIRLKPKEKPIQNLEEKIKERKADLDPEFQEEMEYILDQYSFHQSLADAKKIIVFNKQEREVPLDVDPDALLNRLGKKVSYHLISNSTLCRIKYDAHNIEPVTTKREGGLKVSILNTYKLPEWRKAFPEMESPVLPEAFVKLYEHLFPKDKEHLYIDSWICNCMTKRNLSYLHLRGARGNGKTTFMLLVFAVVGAPLLAREGFKDAFNAEMRGKRIIGFDDDKEIATHDGYKKRKVILNNTITLNEKHVQTTKSEVQTASYIVCSNTNDDYYEEYDERRVVQPTLTENNANESLESKELAFLSRIGDAAVSGEGWNKEMLEFCAQIGHYYLNMSKDKSIKLKGVDFCYKNDQFWDDVVKSFAQFKYFLVTSILSKEHTKIAYEWFCDEYYEFNGNSHRFKLGWEKTKTFIKTFRYKGEKLYSSIDEETRTIHLNPKFCCFEEIDI